MGQWSTCVQGVDGTDVSTVTFVWPCRHTALHLASKRGNMKTIKALLEVGADVNSEDNQGYGRGCTVSHMASAFVHGVLLQVWPGSRLARSGTFVWLCRWTAAQHATAKGHADSIKALEAVKKADAAKKLKEAQAAAWRATKEAEAEEANKRAHAVAAKAEASKWIAEAEAAAWRAKKVAEQDAQAISPSTGSSKPLPLKQSSPVKVGGSPGPPAEKASSSVDAEASKTKAPTFETEQSAAEKKVGARIT